MITLYQTPYGEGSLYWEGKLLTGHRLPGRNVTSANVTGPSGTSANPMREIAEPPATCAQFSLTALLEAYFRAEPIDFDADSLPIDWSLYSPFILTVATALTQVPYGATTTYADLAAAAGHPGAQRAVGSAMAKNRLPILIPCHRVIRSDGTLGHFSAGEEWKPRLLAMESAAAVAIAPVPLPQTLTIT